MTKEELVEEIRNAYERVEASWATPEYSVRVATTAFYLAALRSVKSAPFSEAFMQNEIVSFLEAKLDEAFGKLSNEDFEQVFRLIEENH